MFYFNKKILIFYIFIFSFANSFCMFPSEEFTFTSSDDTLIFSNPSRTFKFSHIAGTHDKYKFKEENTFEETLLLEYLMTLELNKFAVELKTFLSRHSSVFDFEHKLGSPDLVFFFLGLLSRLNFEKYSIEYQDVDSKRLHGFHNIVIRYKESDDVLLEIRIQSVDKEIDRDDVYEQFLDSKPDDSRTYINILNEGQKIRYKCNSEQTDLTISSNDIFLFAGYSAFLYALRNKDYIKTFYDNNSINLLMTNELNFHDFLMGMLANTKGLVSLSSEEQSGLGRSDISFKIKNQCGFFYRYILELKAKKVNDNKDVNSYFNDAIWQFNEMQYGGSGSRGPLISKDVYKIAVVFDCNENDFFYFNLNTKQTNYLALKVDERNSKLLFPGIQVELPALNKTSRKRRRSPDRRLRKGGLSSGKRHRGEKRRN